MRSAHRAMGAAWPRWLSALPVALILAPLSGCVLQRAHLVRWPQGPGPTQHSTPVPAPGPNQAGPMAGSPPAPAGPETLASRSASPVDPAAARVAAEVPTGETADHPLDSAPEVKIAQNSETESNSEASAPAARPNPVDTVPVPRPPVQPPAPHYPIDLSVALRLAEVENPTIGVARTEILAALAEQMAARVLLVPTLNAGTNYHGHTGNLQRSAGTILPLSEQSLYVGGGARTLAAESLGIPAVNIATPLTEAVFEPLAARQRVSETQYDAAATANQILLEVSVLYLDLVAARANLDTLRVIESQMADIVRTVNHYAQAGEGRQGDADRSETDWRMRRAEVEKTEGEVAIASARLAQRLNLDPSVQLDPFLTGAVPLVPVFLVDLQSPPEGLIQLALARRPEMGARGAQIARSEVRLREEMARPFLPTLWLGFSGGAFGGGSNLVPPLLGGFRGRTDFDVRVYWTLLNFGAGNLARQQRQRAQIGAAVGERGMVINQIRDEVSSSLGQAQARFNQIEVARLAVQSAESGFREDLTSSRDNLIRPIEVLNSLNLLADARLNLIRAIIQYNQSQFRLFVSLGSPPPLPSPPGTIAPPVAPPAGPPVEAAAPPPPVVPELRP